MQTLLVYKATKTGYFSLVAGPFPSVIMLPKSAIFNQTPMLSHPNPGVFVPQPKQANPKQKI